MRVFLLIMLLLFYSDFIKAGENRGGRIEWHYVSGFTYEIQIITYVKTSSSQSGQSQLDSVYFGDSGTAISIARDLYIDVSNDLRVNYYTTVHTYPGPGTYKVHFTDPNRIANIRNIPNSVATPLHLESEFTIDPGSCTEDGPRLYNEPLPLVHSIYKDLVLSRAAKDQNWDSLSYLLVDCMFDQHQSIVGYTIPSGVSLNPVSGEFKWIKDSMFVSGGAYNFGIKILEWRNGIQIGYILEELEVELINNADTNYYFNTVNYPSGLTTHILPGDTFNLHVEYTDSSQGFDYFSDLINATWFGSPHIGDLSFVATVSDIRNDPFRILLDGRSDLTYLLYVDGISNGGCGLIGIGEHEIESRPSVYPNPTDGKIYFDFNPGTFAFFDLYDATGKIIRKNSPLRNEMDISNCSAGIYFLVIHNSVSIFRYKLIKV